MSKTPIHQQYSQSSSINPDTIEQGQKIVEETGTLSNKNPQKEMFAIKLEEEKPEPTETVEEKIIASCMKSSEELDSTPTEKLAWMKTRREKTGNINDGFPEKTFWVRPRKVYFQKAVVNRKELALNNPLLEQTASGDKPAKTSAAELVLINAKKKLAEDEVKKSTSTAISEKEANPKEPVQTFREKPAWVKAKRIARAYYPKVECFTPQELAEKRRNAIEKEACKKLERRDVERRKTEERWVQLGKAICSLKPEDFGLLDHLGTPSMNECDTEEFILNVSRFASNIKHFLGIQAKGTVLVNSSVFAGALCNVNCRAIPFFEHRVQRKRKKRIELINREKQSKERMEERWIEIGKSICLFSAEDIGLCVPLATTDPSLAVTEISSESLTPVKQQKEELTESTPNTLDNHQKDVHNNSEKSDFTDDDDEEYDTLSPPRKKRRKLKNFLAWRGEDIIANVFHFATALRDMMGPEAKHTIFRTPFGLTSVFCNVADKSVRDRHTKRKVEDARE